MTKTFKVVAKEINNDGSRLTVGKVYEASRLRRFKLSSVICFTITNDEGIKVRTEIKDCPFIGADWTIITEPAKYRDHVEVE